MLIIFLLSTVALFQSICFFLILHCHQTNHLVLKITGLCFKKTDTVLPTASFHK